MKMRRILNFLMHAPSHGSGFFCDPAWPDPAWLGSVRANTSDYIAFEKDPAGLLF